MKAVEQNISRHENGGLYFAARRNGRLVVKSLRTKKIEEARRNLNRFFGDAFSPAPNSVAAREPEVPLPEVNLPAGRVTAPATVATVLPSLAKVLTDFEEGQICKT